MTEETPAHPSLGDPLIWALQPGETIERQLLHDRYGGRERGLIVTSRRSPNVLLFSDPHAAAAIGNFDGWRADGCYHFSGEGVHGDQRMRAGNAAILKHASAGRAIRLFGGTKGLVSYEGSYTLPQERPYYTTDAGETGGGPARSVIVFRLTPVDVHPKPSTSPLDAPTGEQAREVPVQERFTERAFIAPGRKASESYRRERALLIAFHDHLLADGHELTRPRFLPAGEAKPLFADLLDRSTNTLYVAKGSVERGAIRMALGQLLDYNRLMNPPARLAILLPERPREDLEDLAARAGVDLVWRERKAFVDSRHAPARP